MKCPVCKETALVMADRQGIEIDYCPDCRGVWLDRGELDKIIERVTATLSTPTRVATAIMGRRNVDSSVSCSSSIDWGNRLTLSIQRTALHAAADAGR